MIYRENNIGACCRAWREDKNITVADMANYSNCKPQNITAFERGETLSGRILLNYVKKGLVLLAYSEDMFICDDINAFEGWQL